MSRTAPGANISTSSALGGGMMGGFGAGGGGMGGMGGGGMGGMGGMMGATGGTVRNELLAQVGAPGAAQQPAGGSATRANVAPRPASPRITFGALISAITTVVEPQSWDELGGDGSIQPVGVSLAVSNTAAVHAKLGKFLEALRSENDALRSISIDAYWLSLDDEQLAKLRSGDKKRAGSAAGITRETLAALPEETRKASAQITCLNGQTVHLISGLMKTKLQGGSPVVGGPGDPGYQPIINTPHLGALLQITPSVLPGDEAAMVDLHSSVTRWENQDETVKLISVNDAGETVVQIDRLKVGAQQLATSLRAPLGKPVLVGGMSQAAGDAKNAGGVERLYLIIEITAPVEK
jgi:hypothetical protein